MLWFKENKRNIFIVLLNIMLAVIILRDCLLINSVNYIYIIYYLFIGVFIYWIYDYKIKSLEKRILLTMVLISALLVYVIIFRDKVISFITVDIVNNIEKIDLLLINRKTTEFYMYKSVITLFIPLIVILSLWFVRRGLGNILIIAILFILIFYWCLGYHDEIKKNLNKYIFVSLITYGVNYLNVYIKRAAKFSIKNNLKLRNIFIAIFIMVGCISLVIPVLPQGKPSKYTKRLKSSIGKVIGEGTAQESNKDKYGYSLGKSGYSDSSKKLGGTISVDNKEVFRVEYNGRIKNPSFYLKGSIKDNYTGKAWFNTFKIIEKGDSFVPYYNGEFASWAGEEESIVIYPDNINTSIFFTPNYPKMITNYTNSQEEIYLDRANGIFYAHKSNKFPYEVNFYNYELISKDFNQMSFSKDAYIINIGDLSKYLQLPDTITERTVNLVYDIVQGASTNYDKAKRIRDYLIKNYTYSLQVSEVPEQADFVDHFLFEEKKGYCVYFASAMTIMCRIAGIPSKYVEGFKMSTRKAFDDKYLVTNEDAHAWTEIYLFSNKDDKIIQSGAILVQMDASTTPNELKNKKNEENKLENLIEQEKTNIAYEPKASMEKSIVEKFYEKVVKQITFIKWKEVNSTIAIILILYLCARIYCVRNTRIRVLGNRSNIPLYIYTQKRLEKIGIYKNSTETDIEFGKKINDVELSNKVCFLIEVIYGEFYGGIRDTEFNKQEFYEFIEGYIKMSQRTIRYYLKKYII
ncbi:hypothetical protein CPJCM30710_21400 [Clostridium polyendosporum]|uniref:Transglutaminase-like domain-containing protein n=1 Tax=Clostridium polyendosporum TaxID=69208 RepID=A0A919VES1_9CLOT|nr:transglutaminase-like domain-containing protein [Clostridium polyendosporum]GIM29474.1 hypothetical protein CPJCM30710_21400 [Clostridium polyendosporum]